MVERGQEGRGTSKIDLGEDNKLSERTNKIV